MKPIIAALALLLGSLQAKATAVYDYVGMPFNEFRDSVSIPGSYSASMQVTGFVEFASPLAANIPLTDLEAQVLGFSFFDGRIAWSRGPTAPPFADLFFGTNALGEIDRWSVEVLGSQPLGAGGESLTAIVFTQSILPATPGGTFDAGQICRLAGFARCDPAMTDWGTVANQPGRWTLRGSSTVPEPPTTALVLGLLAALALAQAGGALLRSAVRPGPRRRP